MGEYCLENSEFFSDNIFVFSASYLLVFFPFPEDVDAPEAPPLAAGALLEVESVGGDELLLVEGGVSEQEAAQEAGAVPGGGQQLVHPPQEAPGPSWPPPGPVAGGHGTVSLYYCLISDILRYIRWRCHRAAVCRRLNPASTQHHSTRPGSCAPYFIQNLLLGPQSMTPHIQHTDTEHGMQNFLVNINLTNDMGMGTLMI